MPANPHRLLDVMAYRCTPELLGGASVYVRELSSGAKSLWRMFDRDFTNQMSREEAQAPHSVVTNALRCLTGGYVWFDPDDGFLVTLDEVDDDTLLDAFTLMCRRALGTPIDDIDLNAPVPLAERIAQTPQERRLLADYLLTTPGGQPNAPRWVYNTVAWELSRRLSQRVWSVDDHDIALRADSSGGLIAWDDPWANKSGTAHALARVRFRMKTFPNIADPVLLVSSTASRVKSSIAYARTVLVEPDDPTRPIVEVAMAGRSRVRKINAMTLETLARLGMGKSLLHAVEKRASCEREQAGDEADASAAGGLGGIRPIHSRNYKFPIGRGVGMHHLRELDRHIREVLGDSVVSPRIYYETQGFKQRKSDDLLSSPADVVRSLTTMGYAHLRIVCLWSKDENRLRMITGLRDAYCTEDRELDPVEGVPVALWGTSISAVFHHVPEFLAHGPKAGHCDAIEHVPLHESPGMLVGVWAETEYDRDFDAELDESEEDDAENTEDTAKAGSRPKDGEDAKFQGRRTLARRGVVSQFMTSRKPTRKKRPDRPDRDFQAIHSILDLHRSLGIIDQRITDVMVDQLGPYAATDVAHCGIHVRRQSRQGKDRKAKICITAAVLVPPGHEGAAWTLHGWSYTDPQWRPYHEAQVAFHAADYPSGKMTELEDDNAGYSKVAKKIDDALADLVRYLGGKPLTLTVDGLGTRRLWGGLHNNKQGEKDRPGATWLPAGTNHINDRPVAIVRVNKDAEEAFRPIGVTLLGDKSSKPGKKATTNSLYRVESDFGTNSWILVTVPNQYDGAGAGRLGGNKTRWSASHGSSEEGNLQKNEMKANWYTMTGLEIYPLAISGGIPAEKLSAMTARLCHQPLAWANRTKYPVQMHAAYQMDLDHPQYRRTSLDLDLEASEPDGVSGTSDGLKAQE